MTEETSIYTTYIWNQSQTCKFRRFPLQITYPPWKPGADCSCGCAVEGRCVDSRSWGQSENPQSPELSGGQRDKNLGGMTSKATVIPLKMCWGWLSDTFKSLSSILPAKFSGIGCILLDSTASWPSVKHEPWGAWEQEGYLTKAV